MKSIWKMTVAAVAFATAVLAAGEPAQAETYSFTNLGDIALGLFTNYTWPASGSPGVNKAFSINDNGAVVGVLKGTFGPATKVSHVIQWNNVGVAGKSITASDLGFPLGLTTSYSYPTWYPGFYGINSSGQIVGSASTGSKSSDPIKGFVYTPSATAGVGTYSALPYPSNAKQVYAYGINDSGKTVGAFSEIFSGTSALPRSAFISDGVSLNRIPGAAQGAFSGNIETAYSLATDINNNGLVIGNSKAIDGVERAFIYDSNIGNATGFKYLTDVSSNAAAINDSGNVVGYLTNGTGAHAFLYTNKDGVVELGGTNSHANAISNNNVIVGNMQVVKPGTTAVATHAFVYQNGILKDLNDLVTGMPSDFLLTDAIGINNNGTIVGFGQKIISQNATGISFGEQRAFALTLTPTPIPPAVFLFGSGLAGLGFIRRRTRV